MNINKITTLGGTITFDDLSTLVGSDITLVTDGLKEDLLQASLPLEQIIDIGWYPEFSENGAFRISLISDQTGSRQYTAKVRKLGPNLKKRYITP